MSTIFHASARGRRELGRVVFVVLLLVVFALPTAADPTPSLDQLMIMPQGSQVMVIWHFYFKLLPPKFIFREKNSLPIVLDDSATLKQNLAVLATNAFDYTLDGRPMPLVKLSELSIAPDGGCMARLLYPGRKNGRLQLSEPLLSYYPSSYIMDYRIFRPLKRARNPTGYFMGGDPSPVIDYVESDGTEPPSILDDLDNPQTKLFKEELRSAWINTNWLFLALLLVLIRPSRELFPLGLIMAAAWIVPCFFWIMKNLQVPFSIHPMAPGLVTAAVCLAVPRASLKFPLLAVVVAVVGLLNGCFDIQQTSLERPEADITNLLGAGIGFIISLGMVFAIGYFLVTECRKIPGFDRDWRPKMCVAFALIALIVSFMR